MIDKNDISFFPRLIDFFKYLQILNNKLTYDIDELTSIKNKLNFDDKLIKVQLESIKKNDNDLYFITQFSLLKDLSSDLNYKKLILENNKNDIGKKIKIKQGVINVKWYEGEIKKVEILPVDNRKPISIDNQKIDYWIKTDYSERLKKVDLPQLIDIGDAMLIEDKVGGAYNKYKIKYTKM